MFSLFDYDVSRYLFNTLAPRIHRIVSGGYKTSLRKSPRSIDRDLRPRSHFTLTSSRSAQSHDPDRVTSVPLHLSWSSDFKSPLGFLKRTVSSQSSKIPPSSRGEKGAALGDPFLDNPANVEAFRNARKFQDIPGPTALYHVVPFAGTRLLYYPFANETLEDMGGMLSTLQASYGPIMRVRLGYQWVVFIEHLADIQHAVRAYEKELSGRPGSGSIPRTEGPLDRLRLSNKDPALNWLDAGTKPQKLRNAVSRHLGTSASLSMYFPSQDQIAHDMIRQLDRCMHSPLDTQTLFERYALENSGQLCFNHRLGLLGDHYLSDGQKQRLVESYQTVIRCLGEILTGTRVFYTLFKDPFGKRFREARAFVQTWERRQMREVTMTALREKGVHTLVPEECSMLLTLLDDQNLTEENISDILHALMATRSEASATALLMLLASLATNVDKQEKLAADIIGQLGADGPLMPDTLQALPYLGACINESLRLYFPMSSGGEVILSNNIVLSNYLIPAGMPIELNSRRTAKSPIWFEHPGFYIPERWLGDKSEKIPALAFMPFGFIDYGCMGLRSFFFQEISAAAIKIIQRYKIDLPEEFHNGQMKTVHVPFRTPKEPLPFIFTPRGKELQFNAK